MTEISAADERAILDQLRRLQDAHHRGDQAAASAMLADLFDRYGRETVAAVRWRQAGDQAAAEAALFGVFGPGAVTGDD
ncbi:Uncharacterised protein [Nocardia farcinica]|uniref:Uncharacterized protein n=1 Tax=Nocardia farcinica TaxID=37329 RepID=A0A449G5K2_NOCFR|nr:hypothetical protein [Nocardia farcinica]VFA96217.1 Uncharacterised protein [Nocardia farcinica]